MRFIHTGDWHLGRLFHNLHLTSDQRFTLDALVRLAEERSADAVVIAGDVFDRAVPPTEAVELFDDIVGKLALELSIPVIAIAGNHDSATRLEYLSGLARRAGVHVVGHVGAEPRAVEIAGRDGVDVRFWPLAYTDAETARCELARDDIHSHEAALAAQLERVRERRGDGARDVVVAHAFVIGGAESASERQLSVGGSGAVAGGLFDGFDYVALGHLHKPQQLGSERVRYSGSLLKYSFDEADHAKSVSIVDIDADGAVAIEEAVLPVRHDLARVRGTMEELLAAPPTDVLGGAFVEVVLTDIEPQLGAMARLRQTFPGILSLRREPQIAAGAAEELPRGRRVKERSLPELFAEFFEDMVQEPLGEARSAELASVLDEMERDRREAL